MTKHELEGEKGRVEERGREEREREGEREGGREGGGRKRACSPCQLLLIPRHFLHCPPPWASCACWWGGVDSSAAEEG